MFTFPVKLTKTFWNQLEKHFATLTLKTAHHA